MKRLLLFLPLVLLLACSVQKRKYQSGYYVDWHAKTSKKESQIATTSKKPVNVAKTESKETFIAREDNKELPNFNFRTPEIQKSLKATAPPEDTCDVLVFKDGSEIKGKVKEVGTSEIKYKRCDTPDGPTYISRNSDVFMIKYANGTREVIKPEPAPRVQSPDPVRNRNLNQKTDYRQNKYNRQIHPLAIASLVFAALAILILYGSLFFSTGGAAFPVATLAFPFIFSVIATIIGFIAMRKIKQNPELYKGKGLAMPGLIIGLVVVSIYLLIFLVLLLIVL